MDNIDQTINSAVSAVEQQTQNIAQILEQYKSQINTPSDNVPHITDTIPLPPSYPQPEPQPPKWLIFNELIINVSHIVYMNKKEGKICIEMREKRSYDIPVEKNIDEVWTKLQKVFAYGVTKQDNENATKVI